MVDTPQIAFGMGIDKADGTPVDTSHTSTYPLLVRYVIHHTLPKSLDGYGHCTIA